MPVNQDLGTIILRLNPYTNRRQTPADTQSRKVGEMDIYCGQPATSTGGAPSQGGVSDIVLETEGPYQHEWTFRGQPRRVGMAVRVRYRYPVLDSDGQLLHWADDYLLIGYEGAMGG